MTKTEYMKQWKSENRDRVNEHQKRYAANHKEQVAAYQKRYADENRERLNEYRRQWKAKRRADDKDPSVPRSRQRLSAEEQKLRKREQDARYRATHPRRDDPAKVEARRALRKKIMYAAKDRPCMDCDQEFPRKEMHFHHRDPDTKLFNVALAQSRSIDSLHAEIAKCDVLCRRCHRLRHTGGAAISGSKKLGDDS